MQIFIGVLHGLNTLEHQPSKVAAIKGVCETEKGVPFTLFGFPDEEARTTHAAIEIPALARLILPYKMDVEIRGLNEFEGVHPPVAAAFWSFRVMVGVGTLMLIVSWWMSIRILRTSRFKKFITRYCH